MFFRQVLNDDLGCASYVVADGGEAVVVDPKWDVEEYLELGGRHGLRITTIVETHVHADHVSGAPRLAAATGAAVAVAAGAGVERADLDLLDGDAIDVGGTRLTVIATPGHRPEHLSLLVSERTGEPTLLLCGDSLLVGEVARPDLAVHDERAAQEAARSLFRSLRRLLELPDLVEVWPGHLGGSLCGGGSLSPRPSSTVGYERRTNPMLAIENEELFVRRLLASLPERPPRVERTVELNRRGVPVGDDLRALDAAQVRRLLRAGAVLIDGREPDEFERGHVPGSLNVPGNRAGFATRCATLVDPDGETVVLGYDERDSRRLASLLGAVGFTRMRGLLQDGLAGWSRGGPEYRRATAASVDAAELARLVAAGAATVLDVRSVDEWERGHVRGSLHVPWAQLPHRLDEVRAAAGAGPVVVACASGVRAAPAASLLRREGIENVCRLRDGGVASLVYFGVELETGGPFGSRPRPIQDGWPAAAVAGTTRRAAR
jgi:glyoxylase-like metal-dependent hydrolase (beta-lactamase superfamily II)/rhodanese-related sulfurtransferase